MSEEKPKFYRVDDVPATVRRRFAAALDRVRQDFKDAGAGHVSAASAFVGLLVGVDIDQAIVDGRVQARAFADEDREDLHYHLPAEIKADVDNAASRCGVNIGALGRLVMTSVAGGDDEAAAVGRLVDSISKGLVSRKAGAGVEAPERAVEA